MISLPTGVTVLMCALIAFPRPYVSFFTFFLRYPLIHFYFQWVEQVAIFSLHFSCCRFLQLQCVQTKCPKVFFCFSSFLSPPFSYMYISKDRLVASFVAVGLFSLWPVIAQMKLLIKRGEYVCYTQHQPQHAPHNTQITHNTHNTLALLGENIFSKIGLFRKIFVLFCGFYYPPAVIMCCFC